MANAVQRIRSREEAILLDAWVYSTWGHLTDAQDLSLREVLVELKAVELSKLCSLHVLTTARTKAGLVDALYWHYAPRLGCRFLGDTIRDRLETETTFLAVQAGADMVPVWINGREVWLFPYYTNMAGTDFLNWLYGSGSQKPMYRGPSGGEVDAYLAALAAQVKVGMGDG